MSIPEKDKHILRELGKRYMEAASLPVQEEKRRLWKRLNSLDPVRPMVTIDQVCWHEMDHEGELTNLSESPFCREIETYLRRKLYAWNHMRADMVLEPFIEIPMKVDNTELYIDSTVRVAVTDKMKNVVSREYGDSFRNEDDLERLVIPDMKADHAANRLIEEQAAEIFSGRGMCLLCGMVSKTRWWIWR